MERPKVYIENLGKTPAQVPTPVRIGSFDNSIMDRQERVSAVVVFVNGSQAKRTT